MKGQNDVDFSFLKFHSIHDLLRVQMAHTSNSSELQSGLVPLLRESEELREFFPGSPASASPASAVDSASPTYIGVLTSFELIATVVVLLLVPFKNRLNLFLTFVKQSSLLQPVKRRKLRRWLKETKSSPVLPVCATRVVVLT
jgi:hypothetical protein